MAFETEMIKLLKENNNLNTKIKERDDQISQFLRKSMNKEGEEANANLKDQTIKNYKIQVRELEGIIEGIQKQYPDVEKIKAELRISKQ